MALAAKGVYFGTSSWNRVGNMKAGLGSFTHRPVTIVVLDAEGNQLTIQDTGKLEEGDHHYPDKVMAFLKEWAPQKQP